MTTKHKQSGRRQGEGAQPVLPPLEDAVMRVNFLRGITNPHSGEWAALLESTGGRIPSAGPMASDIRKAMRNYFDQPMIGGERAL